MKKQIANKQNKQQLKVNTLKKPVIVNSLNRIMNASATLLNTVINPTGFNYYNLETPKSPTYSVSRHQISTMHPSVNATSQVVVTFCELLSKLNYQFKLEKLTKLDYAKTFQAKFLALEILAKKWFLILFKEKTNFTALVKDSIKAVNKVDYKNKLIVDFDSFSDIVNDTYYISLNCINFHFTHRPYTYNPIVVKAFWEDMLYAIAKVKGVIATIIPEAEKINPMNDSTAMMKTLVNSVVKAELIC